MPGVLPCGTLIIVTDCWGPLLNTLRLGNTDGPIIGFAKGGPLENYKFRVEIKDENYGKRNTSGG